MPISREELEEGRFDLTFQIVQILTGSPDLGFNAEEVRQLLMEIDGRDALVVEVEMALEILVQRDKVRMREMGGRRWYTIVQRRLGFRTEQ